MNKIQIEKNEWKEMIELQSAERTITDGCTFKILSDTIIHIGNKMVARKTTTRDVKKLMEIHDALDLVVKQFKNDVSTWASSFSIGEEEIKEAK